MNNVINKREVVLLKIKEFRLLDDNFMSRVFDDNIECTELILRIILDSYVIFITENDVMGANLPIYHADRIVKETGEAFGDGSHIIYVNGSYRGEDSIGRLMNDFSCKNPEDMYYKQLADSVRHYKQETEGVKAMCRIVEELIEEEKKDIALEFMKLNKLSLEEIARCARLSLEEVEAIAREGRLLLV